MSKIVKGAKIAKKAYDTYKEHKSKKDDGEGSSGGGAGEAIKKIGIMFFIIYFVIALICIFIVSIIVEIILAYLCTWYIVRMFCGGISFWHRDTDQEYLAKYHFEGEPVYDKDIMSLVYSNDGIVSKLTQANEGKLVHHDDVRKVDYTEEGFTFGGKSEIKIVPILNLTSVEEENERYTDELKLAECQATEGKTESECKEILDTYILKDDKLRRDGKTAAEKEKEKSDPNDILVLVNKQNSIGDYKPNDLTKPNVKFLNDGDIDKNKMRKEAATALEKLFAGATKDGVTLVAVSGYRSYETQKTLYANYVKADGEEAANKYSAKAGHSEHQTGLAMDVSAASVNNGLVAALGDKKEGKWLAENAHKYGYIIRYLKGKESITGYTYEPWHIRYVGVDVATEIKKNGWTFEEYKETKKNETKSTTTTNTSTTSTTTNTDTTDTTNTNNSTPAEPTVAGNAPKGSVEEAKQLSGDELFERIYHIDESIIKDEDIKRCLTRKDIFVAAGKKWGIDPLIFVTMCATESSGFSDKRNPTSSAKGLLQLLKGTGGEPDKAYDFETGKDADLYILKTDADYFDDFKNVTKAARVINEYAHQVDYHVGLTLIGYGNGVYGVRKLIGYDAGVAKYNNNPSDLSYLNADTHNYMKHLTPHFIPGYDYFIVGRNGQVKFMNSGEVMEFTGSLNFSSMDSGSSGAKRPEFERYQYEKMYYEESQKDFVCQHNEYHSSCSVEYFKKDFLDTYIDKKTVIDFYAGQEDSKLTNADLRKMENTSQDKIKEILADRGLSSELNVQDLYTTDAEMLVRAVVGFNKSTISYKADSYEVAVAGSIYRLYVSKLNAEKNRTKDKDIVRMGGEESYIEQTYKDELDKIKAVLPNYDKNHSKGIIEGAEDTVLQGFVVELLSPNGGNYKSFVSESQISGILIPSYMLGEAVYRQSLEDEKNKVKKTKNKTSMLTEVGVKYPEYKDLNSDDILKVYENYIKEYEIDPALVNAWVVGKYFERNAAVTFYNEYSSIFSVYISGKNKDVVKKRFNKDVKAIKELMKNRNADDDVEADNDSVIDNKMRKALIENMYVKYALYSSNDDVMEIGEFVKLGCMLANNVTDQSCIDYNVVALDGYKLKMKEVNVLTQTKLTINESVECLPIEYLPEESENGDYVIDDSNKYVEATTEQKNDPSIKKFAMVEHKPEAENTVNITGGTVDEGGLIQDAWGGFTTFISGKVDSVLRVASNISATILKKETVAKHNPEIYGEVSDASDTVHLGGGFFGKYFDGGDVYTSPKVEEINAHYSYNAMMKDSGKNANAFLLAIQQKASDEGKLKDGKKVELVDARGVVVGYIVQNGTVYSGEITIPILNRYINFTYDQKGCGDNEVKETHYSTDITLGTDDMSSLTKKIEGQTLGYGKAKIKNNDFMVDLIDFYRTFTRVETVNNQEFLDEFDVYLTGRSKDGTVTGGSAASSDGGFAGQTVDLDGFETKLPLGPDGVTITSGYGKRSCPNCSDFHQGYDIDRKDGSQAYPFIEGTVYAINKTPVPYRGRYVILEHVKEVNGETKTLYTLYQHLSSVDERLIQGQEVSFDTPLGVIGGSGGKEAGFKDAKGNLVDYAIHLHLEVSLQPKGKGMQIDDVMRKLISENNAKNKGSYVCFSDVNGNLCGGK